MPMPPITHRKKMPQEDAVKVVIPLHPKYKKYHVFQHLENGKERHALENWEWFENDRPILQESISRRINRPQEKLMMDQGSYHRLKLENMGIVDSVKRIEDMVRGEALWKMSLRNNWERPFEYNGLSSTPEYWGPERKKEIERIGQPNKEDTKVVYFKDHSRRDRRRSLWDNFDWYIENIENGLDKEHSFYPKFKGLQVRGRSIQRPEYRPPTDGEVYDEDEEDGGDDVNDEEANRRIPDFEHPVQTKPKKKEGPAATLSQQNLLFCGKPGDINERTVTVKNKGNTAIFYSWERRPVEPLVLPGQRKEGWRLFTVMRGTGSLLPGYARTFTFKYSSREVGTHLEPWICRIYPKLDKPVQIVDLKGVTMFDDRLRKWRTAFTGALEYREMMTGVREALADVLTSAGKASRPPEELRNQEYLYTKAAFDFIRFNLAVSPPVFFGPKVFAELEKLNQAASTAVPKAPCPPKEEVVIEEETDRSRRKSKKEGKGKKGRSESTGDEQADGPPEESKKSKSRKSKGEDATSSQAEARAEDSGNKKKGKKRSKEKAEGEAEASVEKKNPRKKSRKKDSRRKSQDATSSRSANESLGGAAASPPQPNGMAPDASSSTIEVSPAAWAGSVSSILEAINTIAERGTRRQLKKQLNALLETAAVPNHQTSLLLRPMYKSLHQISGDVENVLESITEESGRPVVEKLLQTYYRQIEAEQAAAESIHGSEAGEDPEDLSWPFKDDDSDTDWLPEDEKNQVKKERANGMLAFIMKWIHILTEARCILRYGFDKAQDWISDEQASVAAMIDLKIAEYSQRSTEDDCWKVFDFERKKQHLQEELVRLPVCQLPNCPDCPRPEEPRSDPTDDSDLFFNGP